MLFLAVPITAAVVVVMVRRRRASKPLCGTCCFCGDVVSPKTPLALDNSEQVLCADFKACCTRYRLDRTVTS